jgi:hypothetical protein
VNAGIIIGGGRTGKKEDLPAEGLIRCHFMEKKKSITYKLFLSIQQIQVLCHMVCGEHIIHPNGSNSRPDVFYVFKN